MLKGLNGLRVWLKKGKKSAEFGHNELIFLILPFTFFIIMLMVPNLHAQTKTIDLTNWQSMDAQAYIDILKTIEVGDTLVYGPVKFEIKKRLGNDGGSIAEPFLLADGEVLRLTKSIYTGGYQDIFIESQKAYKAAGVNVVDVDYSRSSPPSYVVVKYVNHAFTMEDALPLYENHDATKIEAKLGRPLTLQERTHIRKELEKFVESLAPLGEVDDFHPNQIPYDLDSKSFLLFDFRLPPEKISPNPHIVQKSPVDYWKENSAPISDETYRNLNVLVYDERERLFFSDYCDRVMRELSVGYH